MMQLESFLHFNLLLFLPQAQRRYSVSPLWPCCAELCLAFRACANGTSLVSEVVPEWSRQSESCAVDAGDESYRITLFSPKWVDVWKDIDHPPAELEDWFTRLHDVRSMWQMPQPNPKLTEDYIQTVGSIRKLLRWATELRHPRRLFHSLQSHSKLVASVKDEQGVLCYTDKKVRTAQSGSG